METCEKTGALIVINSDTHTADEIEFFDHALKIIEETGFPGEKIVNISIESIERFFGIKWNGS